MKNHPDKPPTGKPLDPKKQPIMSDGRTFKERGDELADALVAGLNRGVVDEHGPEPDEPKPAG